MSFVIFDSMKDRDINKTGVSSIPKTMNKTFVNKQGIIFKFLVCIIFVQRERIDNHYWYIYSNNTVTIMKN